MKSEKPNSSYWNNVDQLNKRKWQQVFWTDDLKAHLCGSEDSLVMDMTAFITIHNRDVTDVISADNCFKYIS